MIRRIATHLYNRSAEVNLGLWSIHCRYQFLHKTSTFWSEWCGHHFGGPFQHLHTVCATCWHDAFAVHHHFPPTTTDTKFRCRKLQLPLKRKLHWEILSLTKFTMSLLLHINLSLEYYLSDGCLCQKLQVSPTRSANSNRKTEFLTNTNIRG